MTQGSSLLFRARDLGKPIPFTPPSWAAHYLTEESLYKRSHNYLVNPYGVKEYAGYWWIEIGAPFNIIDQNEDIRDELLRHVLGVWDHIKNRGDHEAENMAIEWIGFVPGKRESRRLIGDYILTESDVREGRLFPDRIAYGGWSIDIHTMGGILAKDKPPDPSKGGTDVWGCELSKVMRWWGCPHVEVYSIPLRCLYSKNIKNLLMAGRDISVTHVALGTTRVQLTCAVIGQAAGTTAALCVRRGVTPRTIANNPKLLRELQQTLLKDDCFIPDLPNSDPKDLALRASVTASSSMTLTLEPIEGGGSLGFHRSQIFPVTEDRIETLSLFIESSLTKEASIRIELMPTRSIWSFNGDKKLLTSMEALVQPRFRGWINFELGLKVKPKRLYQVNVYGEDGIRWVRSKPLPGVASAYKEPSWRRWIHTKSIYALRLNPPSKPFEPENVISGVARPEKWTNIWISDPNKGFPQSLTIDFGGEVQFNTVYLTFDTYLYEGYHMVPTPT